jgi:subtilisin
LKDTVFEQWTQNTMKITQGPHPKYIIRFHSLQNYNRCMTYLNSQAQSSIEPKVLPLKSIRGISCSMEFIHHHPSLLPMIASIETDFKTASVHAQGEPFIPWGVSQIRAPEVWSRSTGRRIKIGLIDTGVDYSHPDLQHSIYGGINLIHRQLLPMDDNGHGTHIAGIISAATEKSGIIGVAPHGAIHAVKAFDYNGSAFVTDIIQAIEWCVRYRMDIINMSFGMKSHSKALEAAIRHAVLSGKVVVASSGNNGKMNQMDYPARFPQTIAVGASTQNHKIAKFSNRGHRIDIYAPGEQIYSTWLHGKYHVMSGTSMATSHVTGVIALMLSVNPGLSPRQIKTILQRNANSLGLKNQASSKPGEVSASRTLKSILTY